MPKHTIQVSEKDVKLLRGSSIERVINMAIDLVTDYGDDVNPVESSDRIEVSLDDLKECKQMITYLWNAARDAVWEGEGEATLVIDIEKEIEDAQ